MIQESTQLWREPADVLLAKADNTVANHFSALCKQHFKRYTVLRNLILYVNRILERCLPASDECFEQRKTYSPPVNLWKAGKGSRELDTRTGKSRDFLLEC